VVSECHWRPVYRWVSTVSMAIDRRQFLLLTAGSVLPVLCAGRAHSVDTRGWQSCRRDATGHHAVCVINERGQTTQAVPLPGRGHAVARHPRRAEAVALARRPGTFMMVVELRGPGGRRHEGMA
jgi:hypothetical protein